MSTMGLFRQSANTVSMDSLVSFYSVSVRKKDWAVLEIQMVVVLAGDSLLRAFERAEKYTDIRANLDAALKQNRNRFQWWTWAFRNNGISYQPSLFSYDDNLFNLSNNRSHKAHNPDGTVYTYQLEVGAPLDERPQGRFKQYSVYSTLLHIHESRSD